MSVKHLSTVLVALIVSVVLVGCAEMEPEDIHYGSDQCDYCKMTIADKSFGAELISQKGKKLKYDSIECLVAADVGFADKSQEVHSRWVTDFKKPGQFLNASTAWIVASERRKSPMGVGLLATGSEQAAQQLVDEYGGRIVSLSEIREIVRAAWKLGSTK